MREIARLWMRAGRGAWLSRVLIAGAPLLLAVVLGCPADAKQSKSAAADSITVEPLFADTTVYDTDPTPSPDGQWLAYTSGRDSVRQIWIKPIAGPDRGRQLTNEPITARTMTPTWAPDSKSLLFISTRSRDYNIYSIPFEGGEPQRMSDARASNRFAVYSPDGKQIVFPSNREKPGQIWGFDLYMMDAGGERAADRPAHRLTSNQGSPGHPTWSPDGKWIAYVAKPIDTTKTIQVGPGMTMKQGPMFTAYHLYRVPPRGGSEEQLTGKGSEPQPTEEIWPTWSPDGRWIAVQRRVGPTDDVWVYEVATGNFFPITRLGNAGKPTWSADGKAIWFVRFGGKDQDIWIAKNVTDATIRTSAQRDPRTQTAGR